MTKLRQRMMEEFATPQLLRRFEVISHRWDDLPGITIRARIR
jgi:hypothetical protein